MDTELSINTKQISIYFILTFVISWCAWILVVGYNNLLGTEDEVETTLPVAVMAMLLGPFLVGLILTRVYSGKNGIRELFSRLSKTRLRNISMGLP